MTTIDLKHMIVAPNKAVNAGGVATSALEISQNSQRLCLSEAKVDEKLHTIIKNIHDNSAKAAEENGLCYNMVAGTNIARFVNMANAMMAQGMI